MEESAPTVEYMRQVAQRFLDGEDRRLAVAKHLACYVLALADELDPPERD